MYFEKICSSTNIRNSLLVLLNFGKKISKIFVIILKQYLQALLVLRNFVKIMLLLFRRK
jgi:hypothetical protein